MSDRETVDFLATVPLLEGREEADLVELARVMRRRTLREGEVLWRQGDEAREMVFVVDGARLGVAAAAGRSRGRGRHGRPRGHGRRDRDARRRRAHDERARDRGRRPCSPSAGRLRRAARPPHPWAFASSAASRRSSRRACVSSSHTWPGRSATRRPAAGGRPPGARRAGAAARPPARTSAGWRVPRLRSAGAPGLPDFGKLCAMPAGRTLLAEGKPSRPAT